MQFRNITIEYTQTKLCSATQVILLYGIQEESQVIAIATLFVIENFAPLSPLSAEQNCR